MESRRGSSPRLVSRSVESLIAASSARPSVKVEAMPARRCSKVVDPGPWRTTYSPGVRTGAGVGHHTSPVSSSRMYTMSLGGSLTGSLCQGVSR
jgi:hypothetical protein